MGVGVDEALVLELDVAAAVSLEVEVAAEVPLAFVCSAGGADSVALVEDSAAAGVVLDVLPESSAADADETAAATAGSSAGFIKNNTID